MSKYLEPLLKIMILLMSWVSIMRMHYMWVLGKIEDKEDLITIRDRDGDISILIILLLVMNKSIFDRFKYSFQPLLRHFHIIVIVMFIAYCILQLTQFVVLTKKTLVTTQGTTWQSDLKGYEVKKHLYGYKFIVYYMNKKDKKVDLSFITSRKRKQSVENRLQALHVNIV